MTDNSQIFEFERDFAGTLHCIPMIVRFKLDLCGVKLSLRQWSRFERQEREQLILRPCHAAREIPSYRAYLVMLISVRAGEQAVDLPIDANPEWEACANVPGSVKAKAASLGLPAPAQPSWAALTPLQRFTLLKLTREGHDNENFEPALREFGLLAPEMRPARPVDQLIQ
jgi:hypothetical protein